MKLIKRKYVNMFCKICFAPTLAQKMPTLRLYRDDVDRCIARHLKHALNGPEHRIGAATPGFH